MICELKYKWIKLSYTLAIIFSGSQVSNIIRNDHLDCYDG